MVNKLPPFPGRIERVMLNATASRFDYTPEQLEWLRTAYETLPFTTQQIADKACISRDSLIRLASRKQWKRRYKSNRGGSNKEQVMTASRLLKTEITNPDEDLIRACKEAEDVRPRSNVSGNPIIGPCIGKTCVLYGTFGCMASKVSTSKRKFCDALF